MDNRIEQLSRNLVHYSCKVQPGERVQISVIGATAYPLVQQLIRDIYAVGAYPYVKIGDAVLNRELMLGCSEDQLSVTAEIEMAEMQKMDAYIGIRATENITEMADVPEEQLAIHTRMTSDVLEERVNHTKWVILRYPTPALAQLANTSLDSFTEFFFRVCNLDYRKMSKAMDALVTRMNATDKVRLTGPGTDLTFSIADIPAIKCDGTMNIPDGEVYTAPVRNSVNGTITFNTPSVYNGYTFENISFTFADGRITEASANNTEKLNAILNLDEGARYIGEFAIGVNPFILQPMKETLFDEKIMGSIHFTPGRCYEDADNGNVSCIHWDLVLIQTPEYGGGEIWFDDVLIRKDGRFVVDDLLCLNAEALS